jgi:glycosyltransferase involved in cell wall biosynthesis
MKILQMISKNDRYGAQRIFLDQVASLKALGHEVTVAVKGTQGYVTDSVRAMGVACHGSPMQGIKDLLALRRLIKERRIDIIHTVLDRADHLGLILSWITGRPVVSTMMVPRVHPGYRFMDRVVTLVNKQAALLAEKGVSQARIRVIRPGIDVERFSRPDAATKLAWKQKLGSDRFSIVFCHISSLLTRKAHLVSIELASECRKRGERPLLVVIGDPVHGEYYESLIRRSEELGIGENIFFTGWTSDVPEILALSHFTVLPSENEALGVVLMEGMAARTPIVARDGEGGAELVNEYGTGFLYRPEDGVSGLAGEIVSLKRDKDRFRRMSDRCARIAEEEFSLSRFGKKLETLYREVLER